MERERRGDTAPVTVGSDVMRRAELSVRPLLDTQTRSPHLSSPHHQSGPQLVPDIRRERAVEMVRQPDLRPGLRPEYHNKNIVVVSGSAVVVPPLRRLCSGISKGCSD